MMKKVLICLIILNAGLIKAQSDLYFTTLFLKNNCKDSIGTLKITPRGGVRPYKVTVEGKTPNAQDTVHFTFNNIKEGNNTIKIMDNVGTVYQKVDFVQDSNIIVNWYFYGSQCGSKGNLQINTYGGIPPYKYTLDGIVTTEAILSNVASGAHSLLVADAAGCTKTITFTLKTNGPNINIDSVPMVCTDTVPQVSIKATGGQAPYKYYVNGVLKTSNFFKLNTGIYTIVVEDANGCSDSIWHYARRSSNDLFVTTTFKKAQCLDSVGTLTITNTTITASQFVDYQLDSRAFSTILTFTNVKKGIHTLKARTTEGCIFTTSFYVWEDVLSVKTLEKICLKKDSVTYLRPTFYEYPKSVVLYAWFNNSNANYLTVAKAGTYSVTLTNTEACSVIVNFEVETCVWAGDTDTSGVVDNRDFLNIGLAYGETGIKRDTVAIYWAGQFSKPWSKQTSTSTNYKHIDTNGDGVINALDTTAILQNWSRMHNLVNPKGNGSSSRGVAPSIYVKTDKITEGVNVLPIIFGDANAQAQNVYGLAYTIDFDENIIDENSLYVAFNNSWFGSNNSLAMYKVEGGKVHIALTKTNKTNLNGSGVIAQLYFKVKTGSLNKNIVFKTENQIAINSNAQEIPTQTQTTNTNVTTGISDKILEQSIQIYPNPASNNLTVEALDLQIREVSIMDMMGRIIRGYKTDNTRFELPLNQQAVGSYFVKILTDKGVVVKRFVKI
jgi:hypothetical protein